MKRGKTMETNGEKWMRADNGIYVPNKKVYVPEYIRIKSPKELQKMDGGQRGEYYSELKWYLNQADISKGNSPDFRKAISLVGEMMRSRNYDLSKIRGLEEVRKQCKGRPVIAHIETKPATCLGFKQYDGGHYIVIYDVYSKWGFKYYKVADPTRGLQTCRAKVLNNATKGRDIKYYSIIPK